jgi:hypothetical protein
MSSLSQLKELALADSRAKHPSLPESARSIRSYNPRTANGLTRAVIDFLKFSGWQAERISCTGRYVDGSKIITDTLGDQRRIGSGKWIPGTGTKGTADISAIINKRSVKVEIKMRDRQSPDQKAYQQQVESAGGLYWIVRSFDEFLTFYNGIQ